MTRYGSILILGLLFVFSAATPGAAQEIAAWRITTVDSTGDVGWYTSLAVVGGQPAISYYNETNGDLKYARYNGATWDIETVDSTGNVGYYTSLAVVNGQPAISYYDYTNGDLKYARYNGATWDIEIVNSTGNVGYYTSLAVVDGQPAISYYDETNDDLKYARFNGLLWITERIDRTGDVGKYTSLAVVDGQPAISYSQNSDLDLKYARYNGTTWDIETVDSTGNVGWYTSLAVVGGQPTISYYVYGTSNLDLKYARYNGTTWDIETIDSTGDVGQFTSLAVVGGQPAIIYHDNTNGDLKYARYNGTTWDIETVDSSGDVGVYTSLAVVNGQPAISYYDYTNGDLKYARLNTFPTANGDNYTGIQDTPLTVAAPGLLGNDTDADNDTLTAVIIDDPLNGAVSINADGAFTYTPDAGFTGTDVFAYKAHDGLNDSGVAAVRITVNVPLNTAPVAADDSYSTPLDTTLTIVAPGVLVNDSDADGDTLSATVVADPANGLVTLSSDGSFIYIPDAGFSGTDSFTYSVTDGTAPFDTATVIINMQVTSATEVICPAIPDLTITAEMENDPPEAPAHICTLPNQGRPTLTWRNDPRADWYEVWIGNSETTVLFAWYPKDNDDLPVSGNVPFGAGAAVRAQCDGLTCTLKPDIDPTAGTYQVWMQAWGTPTNDIADGQLSTGGPLPDVPSWNGGDDESNSGFTLPNISPGAIIPMTPTISADGTVSFQWQGALGATWYNIWIGTAPEDWQQVFFDWALAEHLGCENGGVCTLTAGVDIAFGGEFDLVLTTPGEYIYYVRSWGPGGFSTDGNFGMWQESSVFTVD